MMIDVSLGETDPPRAGDGTPGVLEAYAGGRALLARLGEHADESAIAELAGRMDENDPAIRALAKALRVFHAIYKPDAIRLCGGVGGALAGALPTLDLLVRRDLTRVAQEEWTLGCVSDPFLAAEGVATLAARTHASP